MRNYQLKDYQKIAVTNIEQQFQASNHTCCILPTGTGKSYVAMAVADQFAGSHVLYVTSMEQTRSDIQDQFEKYELECDLDYSLYCNLDSNTVTDYSLIVLDEFHRAGAEEWSKYVKRVLNSNPQAKVLGLTATPYRYMDNRDMAEELFGGNVAYRMELSDAIADGILPLPQYVGCFLDILDVIREAENDYRDSKKQSAEVENLLEKAKQLAGGAPKLPDIIKSHMTNQTGKYIVFCRNIKHLEEMMAYADEWFSFAPEKHLYVAHSDGQKDGYEQFVKDDAPVLRLLYCVDMLNEGVHPKDIAGVIMLRPTASQNVYFQQLGRALTVEERTISPLIIDVVNNATILKPIRAFFADVKGKVERTGRYSEQDIQMLIDINPAYVDILELLDTIHDELRYKSWEEVYAIAEQYYLENGNLLVPKTTVYCGVNLGTWINRQRQAYKKGTLSEGRVALLNAIGMVWDPLEVQWNEFYKAAEKYYHENGDLLVPITTVYHDVNLGMWINTQRTAYKKGALSEERIDLLNAIGMVWVMRNNNVQWNEFYKAAEKYYHENGDLLVPITTVYHDVNLGTWINTQRTAYKKGTLSEERVALLNAIGMVWDTLEAQWNETYSLAEQYYRENGNLLVPNRSVYNGVNLGKWLDTKRQAYKKGTLSEKRIAILNTIGMVWDPLEAKWNEYYQAAEKYFHENGNLLVPKTTVYNDVNLGVWIHSQRQAYKKGILSEKRIAMLNAIGMRW